MSGEPGLVVQEAHNSAVDHLAFSQDGVYLASAGADGMIKFWSVEEER